MLKMVLRVTYKQIKLKVKFKGKRKKVNTRHYSLSKDKAKLLLFLHYLKAQLFRKRKQYYLSTLAFDKQASAAWFFSTKYS